VLRIENGKIAEEVGLDDGVTALTQLGYFALSTNGGGRCKRRLPLTPSMTILHVPNPSCKRDLFELPLVIGTSDANGLEREGLSSMCKRQPSFATAAAIC